MISVSLPDNINLLVKVHTCVACLLSVNGKDLNSVFEWMLIGDNPVVIEFIDVDPMIRATSSPKWKKI